MAKRGEKKTTKTTRGPKKPAGVAVKRLSAKKREAERLEEEKRERARKGAKARRDAKREAERLAEEKRERARKAAKARRDAKREAERLAEEKRAKRRKKKAPPPPPPPPPPPRKTQREKSEERARATAAKLAREGKERDAKRREYEAAEISNADVAPKKGARATRTQAEAMEVIRHQFDNVRAGYESLGVGSTSTVEIANDGWVDGEIRIFTASYVLDSPNEEVASSDLLMALTRFVNGLGDDIWFSIRVFLEALQPLGDDGTPIYNSDPLFAIANYNGEDIEHTRIPLRGAWVYWQRKRGRLYGHCGLAQGMLQNIVRNTAQVSPILSCIAFRMCWNPMLEQPKKDR